ncbi:MAG: ATP-dependent DNA ligase [Paracoccaceae bacterium]
MTPFTALLQALSKTADPAFKTAALTAYFKALPDPDLLAALALLLQHPRKRTASLAELKTWTLAETALPDWLFKACQSVVGDTSETLALLLPPPIVSTLPSLSDILETLSNLADKPVEIRSTAILALLKTLPPSERLIAGKLITATLRLTLPQPLLARALGDATGLDPTVLAPILTRSWPPDITTLPALIAATQPVPPPLPFATASPLILAPLTFEPETLGPATQWLAEYKIPGQRAQLLTRQRRLTVWSREAGLITDCFPDLTAASPTLPATCTLDGMLTLETGGNRNRRRARFVVFDLIECHGQDLRAQPLCARRAALVALFTALPTDTPFALSPTFPLANWSNLTPLRAAARQTGAEGVMLKRISSSYSDTSGENWLHCPPDPFLITAVLVYAQTRPGQGPTDFTFALRDGNDLVPIAKASEGLPEATLHEIVAWVTKHTLERFGPVRRVPPEQVFDLAFDTIQPNPRTKSGFALRNPRITHWRKDLHPDQIDTVKRLRDIYATTFGQPLPL